MMAVNGMISQNIDEMKEYYERVTSAPLGWEEKGVKKGIYLERFFFLFYFYFFIFLFYFIFFFFFFFFFFFSFRHLFIFFSQGNWLYCMRW